MTQTVDQVSTSPRGCSSKKRNRLIALGTERKKEDRPMPGLSRRREQGNVHK